MNENHNEIKITICVFVCSSGCSMPLGMERRSIPSSSISASSFLNKWLLSWSPDLARLHQEGRANAWRPKVSICLSVCACMACFHRVKVNFLSTLCVFSKPIVNVSSALSVLHCLNPLMVLKLLLFLFPLWTRLRTKSQALSSRWIYELFSVPHCSTCSSVLHYNLTFISAEICAP